MEQAAAMLKGHAQLTTLRGVIRHPAFRVGAALIVFLWASAALWASGVPKGFSACTLLTLPEAKGILGPKARLNDDSRWNAGGGHSPDIAICWYGVPSEGLEVRMVSVAVQLTTKEVFATLPGIYRKNKYEVAIIPGLGDGAYSLYASDEGKILFLKGQTLVGITFTTEAHDSAVIMPFARRALARLP